MSYTALQIDGLKELINIGGGHAATSLSKLLQTTDRYAGTGSRDSSL